MIKLKDISPTIKDFRTVKIIEKITDLQYKVQLLGLTDEFVAYSNKTYIVGTIASVFFFGPNDVQLVDSLTDTDTFISSPYIEQPGLEINPTELQNLQAEFTYDEDKGVDSVDLRTKFSGDISLSAIDNYPLKLLAGNWKSYEFLLYWPDKDCVLASQANPNDSFVLDNKHFFRDTLLEVQVRPGLADWIIFSLRYTHIYFDNDITKGNIGVHFKLDYTSSKVTLIETFRDGTSKTKDYPYTFNFDTWQNFRFFTYSGSIALVIDGLNLFSIESGMEDGVPVDPTILPYAGTVRITTANSDFYLTNLHVFRSAKEEIRGQLDNFRPKPVRGLEIFGQSNANNFSGKDCLIYWRKNSLARGAGGWDYKESENKKHDEFQGNNVQFQEYMEANTGALDTDFKDTKIEVWVDDILVRSDYTNDNFYLYDFNKNKVDNGVAKSQITFKLFNRNKYNLLSDPSVLTVINEPPADPTIEFSWFKTDSIFLTISESTEDDFSHYRVLVDDEITFTGPVIHTFTERDKVLFDSDPVPAKYYLRISQVDLFSNESNYASLEIDT